MKSTGIIRRIDELGRVVIPKEIRRSLNIREGDPMELFVEGDKVAFRKYSPLGENADYALAVFKSLCKKGIDCALYDRDVKLMGKDTFSTDAPNEVNNTIFNSCGTSYFPIWVDGDLWGYIAVSTPDAGLYKAEITSAIGVFTSLVELY